MVQCLVLLGDGKIVAGGDFVKGRNLPRANLARLNADGSVDPAFNASANSLVIALTVQPDGKILVGGQFTVLCGQPRNRIGRLNADGTLDGAAAPAATQ